MINVLLGACGLCWMMVNELWVLNVFNLLGVHFGTKVQSKHFINRKFIPY